MIQARKNNLDPYEAIVAGLSDALAKPSDAIPSVRCVSRSTMVAVVSDLQRNLALPASRKSSANKIVEQLVRSRLLQQVPLDDASRRVGPKRLYAVGLGTVIDSLHPFELLQAHIPSGVVCYMSAIEAHGLTTQSTIHHHIARPDTAPARLRRLSETRTPQTLSRVSIGTPSSATPPLGQWQFTYQKVPYYLTVREPRYLQDHQTRYLNDKCFYRVTTLDQTLLDTLHRPMNCGGPAVVFEAWESAAERLNVGNIVRLVEDLKELPLLRRAGYMMERLGLDASPLAEIELGRLDRQSDAPISLLSGIPYSTIDPRWNLLVP